MVNTFNNTRIQIDNLDKQFEKAENSIANLTNAFNITEQVKNSKVGEIYDSVVNWFTGDDDDEKNKTSNNTTSTKTNSTNETILFSINPLEIIQDSFKKLNECRQETKSMAEKMNTVNDKGEYIKKVIEDVKNGNFENILGNN